LFSVSGLVKRVTTVFKLGIFARVYKPANIEEYWSGN
jgi:hypothetical protein